MDLHDPALKFHQIRIMRQQKSGFWVEITYTAFFIVCTVFQLFFYRTDLDEVVNGKSCILTVVSSAMLIVKHIQVYMFLRCDHLWLNRTPWKWGISWRDRFPIDIVLSAIRNTNWNYIIIILVSFPKVNWIL